MQPTLTRTLPPGRSSPSFAVMATHIKGENSGVKPDDDALDEALDESFPASDPPSWTLGNGTASAPDRKADRARQARTRIQAARDAGGMAEDAPGSADVDEDKNDESLSEDEPRHPLRVRGTAPPPSRP